MFCTFVVVVVSCHRLKNTETINKFVYSEMQISDVADKEVFLLISQAKSYFDCISIICSIFQLKDGENVEVLDLLHSFSK
jgi:hypothetical protein